MTIEPKNLVDSHIHLFNARSLPLRGIFDGVPIIKTIALPLSVIFNRLTQDFDLNTDEELDFEYLISQSEEELITDILSKSHSAFLSSFSKSKNQDTFVETDSFTKAIYDLSCAESKEKDTLPQSISQFTKEVNQYLSNTKTVTPTLMKMPGIHALKWALLKFMVAEVKEKLHDFIDIEIGSVLLFLRLMLTNEAKIYELAMAGYTSKKPSHLVHHMMDMKPSYANGKTYYDFHTQQTNNMLELLSVTDGKLIGFTAFHPRTPDALALCLDEIKRGQTGIKFYPPMGYRPSGDLDPEVNATINDFFKACIAGKIPVFTHCTPKGFQNKPGSGLNADPIYWKQLLKTPGMENLRLCFGHAGGGYAKVKDPITGHKEEFWGWYTPPTDWENERNYAKTVVELCQNYPNVYCEVAFLDKVMDPTSEEGIHFKSNFINQYKNHDHQYYIGDKICFGTDWHMLGMVKMQEKYYQSFLELFQDKNLIGSMDNFFADNFLRFLKLK